MTDIEQQQQGYYDESYPPSLWDGGGGTPLPVITSVVPNPANFHQTPSVTVIGTGFIPTSSVWIASSSQETTFVSPTELTAVPDAGITVGMDQPVVVRNGVGVLSAPFNMRFEWPTDAPLITDVSPPTAVVLTPVTLTITGERFSPTCKVWARRPGSTSSQDEMPSVYVSPTQMTVTLAADAYQLQTPGSRPIMVWEHAYPAVGGYPAVVRSNDGAWEVVAA